MFTRSLRNRSGHLAIIAIVALTTIAVGGGQAVAGTPAPSASATVGAGVNVAAIPGATVFGTTDPNTAETVSFILREQGVDQLEQSVERGVGNFLSVSQFARQYGQSRSTIAQLTAYLARFGVTTDVYADDVDVVANGTAGEFDRALSVQQHNYHVPAQRGRNGLAGVPAQNVHGTAQAPLLPAGIARAVLAILGLTNYSPFVSQAVHGPALTRPQASSSNSCVALTGLASACNTPATFASNYGLNSLYKQGATGAGRTIAIVTLAALDPTAPGFFWQHVLGLPASGRTVSVQNIDGGPGAPSDASGTGETDLDVEQSGGLAPGANVIVYQAPNSDPGFADGFFSAASQNVADTVSSSWGESEVVVQSAIASGQESPAYVAAFDEAFLEMAAQGQSGFLASGDAGAYDDNDELGTTGLSVDTSGDSPYITAAGGTTLPWSGTVSGSAGTATVTVSAQRAWGWDYLWQAAASTSGKPLAATAESLVVGGGGGFSTLEPRPSYQQGVPGTNFFSAVQYLTPIDFQQDDGVFAPTAWDFNPTPPVTHGFGSGRAVPDVSTDADPYSGYLLYEPSFLTAAIPSPALQGHWGGTSFVAPQLNGSTAVMDQALGRRIGFWNPAIYSLAKGPSSPFTPLNQSGTANDNVFYSGTPGTLYNPATGLGVPNLGKLTFDLATRR